MKYVRKTINVKIPEWLKKKYPHPMWTEAKRELRVKACGLLVEKRDRSKGKSTTTSRTGITKSGHKNGKTGN